MEWVAFALPAPEQVLERVGHLIGSAALSTAVPKRRAEFAAGRHAAQLALSAFDCTAEVRRADNGAPIWPAGFVGSISHAGPWVAAAVAEARVLRGLGIDLELIVSRAVHDEIRARVLSAAELELLERAFPERSELERFTLGFSSKESLYKCLHPLCNMFFGFQDARITALDAQTLTLTLRRALPGFRAGCELSGPFLFEADHVETAILLPK